MKRNRNKLRSITDLFTYYRTLGLKAIEQLADEALFWQYNTESNSVAIITKHLHGNMLSRWTNFMTSDGEKSWRNRDGEFEATIESRGELIDTYNAGWDCVLSALESIDDEDLDKIVYIRNEGHTALEAIHRQLGHYAYHIGQIVFIAKQMQNEEWKTLSIARNKSKDYNSAKFEKEKKRRFFTDDV